MIHFPSIKFSCKRPYEKPSKPNSTPSDTQQKQHTWAQWYCLNGATCFTVRINDSILYNCWCPVGFHGLRCDYKYLELRQMPQKDTSLDRKIIGFPLPQRRGYNDIQTFSNKGLLNNHFRDSEEWRATIYNLLIIFLVLVTMVLLIRILRKRCSLGSVNIEIESRQRSGSSMKQVQGATDEKDTSNNDQVSIDLNSEDAVAKQRSTNELDRFSVSGRRLNEQR